MAQQTAPYGSWRSPITSEFIVRKGVGFGATQIVDGRVLWLENRPSEAGRSVLVAQAVEGPRDLVPQGFNVRTMAHEYGGGAFLAVGDTVYFSNFSDQRLYRSVDGGTPQPITAEGPVRYADSVLDAARDRLLCVREDHREPGRQAVSTICAVRTAGDQYGEVLIEGNDFYASPRLSPDGSQLAYLTWNHPNMPWDGCELRVAAFGPDGLPQESRLVAGGPGESIFQPEWSPDGVLHFASDRSGFWNLYAWRSGQVVPLHPMAAEFGEPQWQFGMRMYGFAGPGRIVCLYAQDGADHLAELDTASGALQEIPLPYTVLAAISVHDGRAALIAASPRERAAVLSLDLETRRTAVLRRASDDAIDPGYISVPEAITFPTGEGEEAHAFYYAPRNRDFVAPEGTLPPLIVICHGGPTGAASSTLNPQLQFWTSRGFAVVDVDYRGSAGYGRAYRDRLKGNWGLVDVEDCEAAALHLVGQGRVDPAHVAIRGGSAGGYTTLEALSTRDTFKAGASLFGIGDLEIFTGDTHKFESRYMDSLLGPYPEAKATYIARSPIHHLEGFRSPCLFLQGLDDKIVPPNQAELMVAALREKGVPVAYLAFAGEGHGFRRAESIQRSLDAELYFYSRIFGFPLADAVEPIAIENLKA